MVTHRISFLTEKTNESISIRQRGKGTLTFPPNPLSVHGEGELKGVRLIKVLFHPKGVNNN
jgi:hypothetical protein